MINNIWYRIDEYLLRHYFHLRFPRIYKFYEWVIIPKRYNGDFGFREWWRWVSRRKDDE